MLKPTSKRILIRVKAEDTEQTKSGVILLDQKLQREKAEHNRGIVEAIGDEVDEITVGDEVLFREGTFWRNDKRICPDEVEKGLYSVPKSDIICIIN